MNEKYVLFIASDGICDMDKDDGENYDGNIVVEGYEEAVRMRNQINIQNGYGIVK